MRDNILPVAKACFPGKQVLVATRKSEESALEKKLNEKEWVPLALKEFGV
jgi:hypothetical protein